MSNVLRGFDDGFYRVTKSISVGSDDGDASTEIDLATAEYKHKGVLITFTDYSNGPIVEVKFYDESTADGISSEYVSLTVLSNQGGAQPFIIPCRIARIKVTNGPDVIPINKRKIQIGLLN